MSITARKKKVGFREALDEARRGCGEVWTQTLWAKNLLYFEHDYNLTKNDALSLFATGGFTKGVRESVEKLPFGLDLPESLPQNPFCTQAMRLAPSQQRQQTIRRLYDAFNTYFENYKNDESHNPPGAKRYYNCRWLHYHFRHEDGVLSLSMGRGRDRVEIGWPHPTPKNVDAGYEDGEHVLYCIYDSEWQDLPSTFLRTGEPLGDKVAGVDLGERVLATADDGEATIFIDGEDIRRLRRIQNEEKREFAARIDRKQKGSNRWWKLVNAKDDRLTQIKNRIEDRLHKLSTRLVEELHKRGVSTIAIGDISGIREGMEYGADMNRRLHQWCFRQFAEKVEYKAERYGMIVDMSTGEAYTSQACPRCDHRARGNKDGRSFECVQCGFEAHRDQVGALNIRAKYLYPDEWAADNMQAVRATASDLTDFREARGSDSDRKTQLALFSEGGSAVTLTRATSRVEFHPHMECVLDDP
jgi:putative transposase